MNLNDEVAVTGKFKGITGPGADTAYVDFGHLGLAAVPLDAIRQDAMSAALHKARLFFEENMEKLFGPDHDIPMAAGASIVIAAIDAALTPPKSAPGAA